MTNRAKSFFTLHLSRICLPFDAHQLLRLLDQRMIDEVAHDFLSEHDPVYVRLTIEFWIGAGVGAGANLGIERDTAGAALDHEVDRDEAFEKGNG